MKKAALSLILGLTCVGYGQNLNFDWVYTNRANHGVKVASDAQNNAIFGGIFTGSIDLDPGQPAQNAQSAGDQDIYLQKIDPSGQFIWGKSFGGIGIDDLHDIAVDNSGNVYLTGFFANTMRFPGTNLPDIISNGEQDIYIIKIASNGTLQWAKSIGGNDRDEGVSIDVDAQGNLYVSGVFKNQMDFNPGTATNFGTSSGENDVFILKLDVNGDYVDHHVIMGPEDQYVVEINCHPDGSIVVGGYFFGQTHFGNGNSHTSTNTSTGDAYLVKYTSNFQVHWVNGMKSSGGIALQSFAIDANGKIYSTGSFSATAQFDFSVPSLIKTSEGDWDGFILKQDENGNNLFINTFGGLTSVYPKSITVNNNNFYVAGAFEGNIDFDPSPNYVEKSSSGQLDFFVQEFLNNGNLGMVESVGGTGNEIVQSIAATPNQGVYLTGIFGSTVDFNPGVGSEIYSPSGFSPEVFHIRYQNCADIVVESVSACDSYTWQNGDTYQTDVYGPHMSFFNQDGCDSTVVLDLNMHYSEINDISISACSAFTWLDGNTYTESTDTPFVVLTSVHGCDSTLFLDLIITDIDTYIDGDDSTFVAFEADSNAQFQWVNCSENYAIIPGAVNDSFVTHSNDQFAVIIEKNGCIDTSACASLDMLDLTNLNAKDWKLFPNPASNELVIQFENMPSGVQIEVVDLNGKTVLSKQTVESSLLVLPLDLTNGIYFVNLKTDNGSLSTEKLVIQR